MANVKSLRGADLQLYVNGRLFAVATGVRWSTETGRKAIYGIDQYTPFELAPSTSSIKGSVECIRLRQDGGLEGRGLAAPESQMMLEKYFSLAIVDRSTDTVILAIEEAAISSQNWTVNAKGQLTGTFMFEGISWANEADSH